MRRRRGKNPGPRGRKKASLITGLIVVVKKKVTRSTGLVGVCEMDIFSHTHRDNVHLPSVTYDLKRDVPTKT